MHAPQIHLMLNHVPVLGVAFGVIVLGVALATGRGTLARFGVATLVAAAIVAIPVFFSGEPAEEFIRQSVALPESVVETHEGAARFSMVGLGLLGLLAAGTLVRYRRVELPRRVVSGVLLGALAISGLLAWTAHLGGQVRHPELRGGAVVVQSSEDD